MGILHFFMNTNISRQAAKPIRIVRAGAAFHCALAAIVALLWGAAGGQAADSLSLAGEWRFAIAPPKAELFRSNLVDRVTLPGTTQTNRKGPEFRLAGDQQKMVEADAVPDARNPLMNVWTPVHANVASAWYQREVEIPSTWAGRTIRLLLERSKITRIWVDGKECGTCDDICTSHIYNLSDVLAPGKHRLTILVATGPFPPGVGGHHLGGMQGNWNGVIGRIELVASAKTHIESVRVDPDVVRKVARLRITLANPAGGELEVSAKAWNTDTPHSVASKTVPVGGPVVEFEYPLGNDAQTWDEFHPALYQLTVALGDETVTTDFGLREFRRNGTVFTINGRTTFLRGTHDGAHFPITGYAPADVEAWLKIMRTAKRYGINHFRFHTWTPPEAAFAAADREGLYMQPELPSAPGFPYGAKKEHDDYEQRMGEAMLQKWGNHPSFVMLAFGNEIGIPSPGNRQVMTRLVSHFRSLDPTRLYAEGSNNNFGRPSLNPGDDYWTTMRLPGDKGTYRPVRASFSGGNGWLNTDPPSTLRDYTAELKLCPVPLIGHEVAQYTFFPDLSERQKYSGVYRLRNYDVIEKRMQRHNLLEQDSDFVRASGALALICYRGEIEAYLRTPGFGGFQLLDLCDNQEQGTSLVGVLDSFYESKGLITPEQWREFCSGTVPLARFAKFAWRSDETFTAEILVAHYGPVPLSGVVARWSLGDAGGELPATTATGLVSFGSIKVPLAGVAAPAKLTLELAVGPYRNRYPVWVYPVRQQPAVNVTRRLDDALALLAKGGRVLFIPELRAIDSCSVRCGFEPVFWNYMFARQPPTMGILCDPKHPLFADFPTEFHSNWQWFNIVAKARAMILDGMPKEYHPLVQVIDNISTCRKLGLIWEVKVGPGKLLVCTSDLPALQDKPEAGQLLASLSRYVNSPQFEPGQELAADAIRKLFAPIAAKPMEKAARKDE